MKKTNNDNTTIKDVKCFLDYIGFTWKGVYYSSKKRKFVNATTFDDIISTSHVTTLELHDGNRVEYKDFIISSTKFESYKEEFQNKDLISKMVLDTDYSDDWIKFLAQTKNNLTTKENSITKA